MSVAETKIAEPNVIFDRVLACALGEATESVRLVVERMLREGHPEYVMAQNKVLDVLSALPNALPPVAPPAFIKERVMSHVASTLPQNALTQAASESVTSAGRFGRMFGQFNLSLVFSGLMLLAGVFVSGYAVDRLLNGISGEQRIDAQRAPQTQSLPSNQISALPGELTPAVPVEGPKAEFAQSSDRNTNAKQTEADGYNGHMQTNFGVTQAYLYLTSDPNALQYSLAPVSHELKGEGRLLWDTEHEDALLVVSKLETTTPQSHYVLWYLRDGKAPERMYNFNAESGTPMSFFIRHAPSDRVKAVMVTMEKNVQGKTESQEVLKASVKERLHS